MEQTFFKHSKLKTNSVLKLSYYWLVGVKTVDLIKITGHSSQTTDKYCHYFRKIVADSLDFEDIIIGGENIIVEIDESKFGKRKYNRGHDVFGAWVLCGVERTPDRKFFLVEVPDRIAETLIEIIKAHVFPYQLL